MADRNDHDAQLPKGGFCEYSVAVRRAMNIIQRDFRKNIGLASVAAEIGYSPSYLGALFIRETGSSFAEYLQNKRISYAENLLKMSTSHDGDEPLPDGFYEYSNAVRRAMNIVQRDFKKNISLGSVAAEIGYSPNYLGAIFVRETGISFTEYLQDKRIGYAENLLKVSDLSVREISARAGFSSPSYFVKIFKKRRGCTPTAVKLAGE